MASANSFTSSRRDAGEEIDPSRSTIPIPSKSYVVGRYDEHGRVLATGAPVDGERATSKHRDLLVESMSGRGKLMEGYVMGPNGPVKAETTLVNKAAPVTKVAETKAGKAKGKAKTKPAPAFVLPTVYQPEPEKQEAPEPVIQPRIIDRKMDKASFSIVFDIETGKVRSSCDAVLENDLAVMLVYEDEDAMSYIPQKGGQLSIIMPDKREIPVMFLGLQFEWYSSRQQLLIFLKTTVDE